MKDKGDVSDILRRFTDKERDTHKRLSRRASREDIKAFISHVAERIISHAPPQLLATKIEFIDNIPYRQAKWVDETGNIKKLNDDRGYFHLLYLTVCTANGRLYIGKTSRLPGKLNTYYVGSGRSESGGAIKDAIKKYGRKCFERVTIGFCDSDDDVFFLESLLVDQSWITRTDTYNQVIGGRGVGSGLDHPQADKTIYRIIDIQTNEQFDLTRLEAQTKLSLTPLGLSRIIKNRHVLSQDRYFCAGSVGSLEDVDIETCIHRHNKEREQRKEEKRLKTAGTKHWKYDETSYVFYSLKDKSIVRAPSLKAMEHLGLSHSGIGVIKNDKAQSRKGIICLGRSAEIQNQEHIDKALSNHFELKKQRHDSGRIRLSLTWKRIGNPKKDPKKYIFINRKTKEIYRLTKSEAPFVLGFQVGKVQRILQSPHVSANDIISPGPNFNEEVIDVEFLIERHQRMASTKRKLARIKAANQMHGKNNPSYDHTMYQFIRTTGEYWEGTVHEFKTLHPEIHSGSISQLINGKIGTTQSGWSCLNPKQACTKKPKGGPSSHNYDHKIYDFTHITGIAFKGTRSEFRREYTDISATQIHRLVKGLSNAVSGWSCSNPEQQCQSKKFGGLNHPMADKTVYQFSHSSGLIFIGTRIDFRKSHPEIKSYEVNRLVSKFGTTLKNGWCCSKYEL